jgi:type I restriction enzyme S subunit
MKSNYKPIGNYIQRVEHRNRDLKVTRLLGLSMTKEFRETTSNIVGTDMSVYRVMSKYQFACDFMSPIRVNKLPVVLKLDDEPNLVSPAYPVFEIKDKNELDPEYLMMWFRRPEFDRYATFKCDAAIRGGYEWTELCETLIPVPSIIKQREIVKEYNVIQNRIALNQQVIQKLEETAQAIYKQWFVDFEFPDENGKPYKSNGGKMEWNEELGKEIPLGWEVGGLSKIATIIMGQSPEGETYNKVGNGMIFYQGRTDFGYRFPDITTYTTHPKKKALKNDILISVRAPVGDLNIAIEDCAIGRGVGALRSKLKCNSHLFYTLQNLKSHFDISDGEGTIFGSINKDDLHNVEVVYSENEIKKFDKVTRPIDDSINNYCIQNQKLTELKELLLSKLATVE